MSLDQLLESLNISDCVQLAAVFADKVIDHGTFVGRADILEEFKAGRREEVIAWHG